MPNPAIRFGPFTLLPGEQRLLRDGTDVALGPRAFGVLCVLAQRPGLLVSKDELLETVWRGLVVEEANLHVQVSQLRKAIGAEAVITMPNLGYRFALPVVDDAAAAAMAGGATALGTANGADAGRVPPAAAPPPAAPRRRLSVIVLPFVESGAPPEQEYFADAITDDVTTQISKIRGSFVIGSPTAMAHKRESVDIAALARELGVRYALQGRLERTGQAVEANVRLSDAATGAVVWSDVIEVQRSSVSHLRRELVARLAAALGLELIAAEAHRSRDTQAGHPEADDLVMQAMAAGGSAFTPERMNSALHLCEQALQLSPDHAQALAWRARILTSLFARWPSGDLEPQIAQAESDITRSLAQDSLVASSHDTLARVRQQQYRLDAAMTALTQALELNPNDPQAFHFQSRLLIYSAMPEPALAASHRALEISPRDPQRWSFFHHIGFAYILMGQYELAAAWCQKAMVVMPFWLTARHLAAALAHLGRIDESRATLKRMAELWPKTLAWPLRGKHITRTSNNEAYLSLTCQHIAMGLLKAGVADALKEHEAWADIQRRGGKL